MQGSVQQVDSRLQLSSANWLQLCCVHSVPSQACVTMLPAAVVVHNPPILRAAYRAAYKQVKRYEELFVDPYAKCFALPFSLCSMVCWTQYCRQANLEAATSLALSLYACTA